MGNDPTKGQHKANGVQQDIKIAHQRFERYKYNHKQDQLEITIDVPQQKEMKNWETEASTLIKSFQCKQSLLTPIRHEYQPKGWCGNTGSVKIFYENYPYLFSEQIDNRTSMQKHFQEQELWYLLYSLVGCARDFAKVDRKIGDVRPHNIFINQEGQIKIANLFSWPYEKTNFQKTAYQKTLTYLAPEQIQLLEKGNLDNKSNKVLAESFSIGLTLLSSGLLFNADQLYSVENRAMDIGKLRSKVKDWLNLQYQNPQTNEMVSYSPLLKNIVASLCEHQPQNREVSIEIEEILRPFQTQIMNLHPFDKKGIQFRLPENWKQSQQQHYVQQRPPQQQIYYQNSGQPQPQPQPQTQAQQNFNFTQQTYKVVGNIEPKSMAVFAPPPQEIRHETIKVGTNIPAINSQGPPQNAGYDGQNGYRDIFTRYAANQPERPIANVNIPTQFYEQKYQSYAPQQLQHPQIPTQNYFQPQVQFQNQVQFQPQTQFHTQPPQTFVQPFQPQGNVINAPFGINQEYNNQQFLTNTNFQQSQYVTNLPTSSASVPASDFLRKIDQQLENSRKLYPS